MITITVTILFIGYTRRLAPSPLVHSLREHCRLRRLAGSGGCCLPSVTASQMDRTHPALHHVRF